jgi:predicted GIY-YIG superfamily endonuclease
MPRRAFEHREGLVKDFSKKYNCKMLVWYELHESMYEAIAREKPIKAGGRAKKLALIESLNPAWKDLYENADIKSRSPNLSVIASAAKQSRSSGQDWIASSRELLAMTRLAQRSSPSLRAKRSNPEATRQEPDCFVTSLLAMTEEPILASILVLVLWYSIQNRISINPPMTAIARAGPIRPVAAKVAAAAARAVMATFAARRAPLYSISADRLFRSRCMAFALIHRVQDRCAIPRYQYNDL